MTVKRAETGETVDWEQRRRLSGLTLVDNEDGDGRGGGDSPFSNSSSETKLSHIYDVYAGGPENDGSEERQLSRRALSEVLPYDMNLSGSTLVSEKSPKRPSSRSSSRDGKKKIRLNDLESWDGREGFKGRKPQWLECGLEHWGCDTLLERACKPKNVR